MIANWCIITAVNNTTEWNYIIYNSDIIKQFGFNPSHYKKLWREILELISKDKYVLDYPSSDLDSKMKDGVFADINVSTVFIDDNDATEKEIEDAWNYISELEVWR